MTQNLDELDQLSAQIMEFDVSNLDCDGYKWQPTRNILQAWRVAETFPEFTISKFSNHFKAVVAILDDTGEDYIRFLVSAETAPLCIVLACLKAKGIEV